MKKLMITLLIGIFLQTQQVYASQEPVETAPQVVTQNDTVSTEQPVEEKPAVEGEGITVKKIFVAIATPVVMVGAVVAMIVISPIWLVKKAFGSDK